MVQKLLC